MASVSDICNMALSHVGSDTTVTSITPPDGSVEGGYCARFYPIARREALEMSAWTAAKTRAVLSQVDNPSTTWTFAYALPSDCIRPLRILQSVVVTQLFSDVFWVSPLSLSDINLFTERGSADFEIENGVLFTHEPDAVLLYVRDVTDTTKFSATLVSGISYLLAAYLAGPIIKGQPGANTSGTLRQIAGRVLGEAKVLDANSSSEAAEHIPESIRVRG
jgi:hypothetical protein